MAATKVEIVNVTISELAQFPGSKEEDPARKIVNLIYKNLLKHPALRNKRKITRNLIKSVYKEISDISKAHAAQIRREFPERHKNTGQLARSFQVIEIRKPDIANQSASLSVGIQNLPLREKGKFISFKRYPGDPFVRPPMSYAMKWVKGTPPGSVTTGPITGARGFRVPSDRSRVFASILKKLGVSNPDSDLSRSEIFALAHKMTNAFMQKAKRTGTKSHSYFEDQIRQLFKADKMKQIAESRVQKILDEIFTAAMKQ